MLSLHTALLQLLKEMDAICKKHQITYYLEGGSLLGAVRHRGFLPWDDDVDLCITRDNWNKLLAVIDEELPKDRELFCYERFADYPRDTVKYTNMATTAIFPNHILDGHACGQHIDLFILDPVPPGDEARKEYEALACVYSELMMPVYVMCDDIIHHLPLYHKYEEMMKKKGRDTVLNILRHKLFTYEDNNECDTYCLRWGSRHSFYPKAFFGEPVPVTFEDCTLPAPAQMYRFLRAQFGDNWMMIPSQKAQEVHDTYDNLHVPCEEFMADYKPYINYREAEENYKQRKVWNIEHLRLYEHITNVKDDLNCLQFSIELEPICNERKETGELLLGKPSDWELLSYFKLYYERQLNTGLAGRHKWIKVQEAFIYPAARALMMCGRYGDAEKLVDLYNEAGNMLSKLLMELKETVTVVRASMLADEEGRHEDAIALARSVPPVYADQINIALLLLKNEMQLGMNAGVRQRAEELLKCYPESGEVMKMLGDICVAENKLDEASQWYHQCVKHTCNGITLLSLQGKVDLEAKEQIV